VLHSLVGSSSCSWSVLWQACSHSHSLRDGLAELAMAWVYNKVRFFVQQGLGMREEQNTGIVEPLTALC
jgi:hypothetical protein